MRKIFGISNHFRYFRAIFKENHAEIFFIPIIAPLCRPAGTGPGTG
jgi:hypothetical protein